MATTIVSPRIDKKKFGRHGFLAATGGFTMSFVLPEFSRLADVEGSTGGQVNAWLNIGTDESINLTIGSSEMGQGSVSGLAQVLAEDLMVDFARVKTVQSMPSLVNPVPWAPPSILSDPVCCVPIFGKCETLERRRERRWSRLR